ncbi:MAG: 50S ribosomal protein L30 [Actinobacteria bacterium]|nr:MAG: 50S ribosomal protein L30 [Actinomycetota bacterium]
MPKKTKTTAKTLRVTQVRSVIGQKADQKATVRALGLKRINDSVDQVDTPAVRGMIFKVKHLVKVEEL